MVGSGSTEKEIDWGMGREEKIDVGEGEHREGDRLGNGRKEKIDGGGGGAQRRR